MLCVVAFAVAVLEPYLRISDNLEEPTTLGFCIDLKGWDPVYFVDAQAHSCKPTGGGAGGGTDQQFEPQDGAIVGLGDADGHCIQAQSDAAGAAVDVPVCDATETLQRFSWDATAGTLRLQGGTLCLSVGSSLNKAGSTFYKRDLQLLVCETTDAKYVTWRVEGATSESGSGNAEVPPPPPPASPADASCFPSHATATLADGRTARLDSLKAGDRLLAVRRDGSLGLDVVSRFSLAHPTAQAAFVSLTTDAGLTLELTQGHHLPVGPLRALKWAGDVVVGDQVWAVSAAALPGVSRGAGDGGGAPRGAAPHLTAQRVVGVGDAISAGLYNPLLKHGGQPVVNGLVTSFNSRVAVALASVAVPFVESACAATGTCTPVRRAVAALECAAKHLLAVDPACKTYRYIDGAVAVAPSASNAPSSLLSLTILATSVAAAAAGSRVTRRMNSNAR